VEVAVIYTTDEIKRFLAHRKKSPSDVLWVGSFDGRWRCSWLEFEQLLETSAAAEQPTGALQLDLAVVGDGWWISLSRLETPIAPPAVMLWCEAPIYDPDAEPLTAEALFTKREAPPQPQEMRRAHVPRPYLDAFRRPPLYEGQEGDTD